MILRIQTRDCCKAIAERMQHNHTSKHTTHTSTNIIVLTREAEWHAERCAIATHLESWKILQIHTTTTTRLREGGNTSTHNTHQQYCNNKRRNEQHTNILPPLYHNHRAGTHRTEHNRDKREICKTSMQLSNNAHTLPIQTEEVIPNTYILLIQS